MGYTIIKQDTLPACAGLKMASEPQTVSTPMVVILTDVMCMSYSYPHWFAVIITWNCSVLFQKYSFRLITLLHVYQVPDSN